MGETTAIKRQPLTTSTGTLTSLSSALSFSSEPPGNLFNAPQLPTLPLDLVAEILCRLPVKFLLQLRCVCKSWNSLISDDSVFAKKHLHVSTTRHRHHLILSSTNSSREFLLWDSPITSVFSSVSSTTTTSVTHTQLECPLTPNIGYRRAVLVASACDGILCFAIDQYRAVLWNPSIGKFKILPPLENPGRRIDFALCSFGYHHFTNNYKIVAVSFCNKKQVRVHTLGTDSWTSIQDFPDYGVIQGPGIFVSDTVNWLALDASSCSQIIISLDLEKESYQKVLQPESEYGRVNDTIVTLGVLRDCLCILTRGDTYFGVWLMKEYGNEESWTKLFTVPYMDDRGFILYTKAVYIYEDDQVLLEFLNLRGKLKLVVYDSRNGTFKIPEIQDTNGWLAPEVRVESLISPFSSHC